MQVHPFCYQIYKSSVCFVTSFIVLAWNHFIFTWWGTVRSFKLPQCPLWFMPALFAMVLGILFQQQVSDNFSLSH